MDIYNSFIKMIIGIFHFTLSQDYQIGGEYIVLSRAKIIVGNWCVHLYAQDGGGCGEVTPQNSLTTEPAQVEMCLIKKLCLR
jgi:hypothetical protein